MKLKNTLSTLVEFPSSELVVAEEESFCLSSEQSSTPPPQAVAAISESTAPQDSSMAEEASWFSGAKAKGMVFPKSFIVGPSLSEDILVILIKPNKRVSLCVSNEERHKDTDFQVYWVFAYVVVVGVVFEFDRGGWRGEEEEFREEKGEMVVGFNEVGNATSSKGEICEPQVVCGL